MRNFLLCRIEDEAKISSENIIAESIAEGVEFLNKKCVLCWTNEPDFVAIYDSINEMIDIHGHDGKNIIYWYDKK
jgi:hypothetical protein